MSPREATSGGSLFPMADPYKVAARKALIDAIRSHLDAGERPPAALIEQYFAPEATTEVLHPGETRLDPDVARRIGPAMLAKLNEPSQAPTFTLGGVVAPESSGEATMTITEFLLARVAEDEAAAQRWSAAYNDPGTHPGYHFETINRHRREWPVLWRSLDHFTPARVLAECAAKRAVIAEAQEVAEYIDANRVVGSHQFAGVMRRPIFALAAVYQSHPDYNPEWAVT